MMGRSSSRCTRTPGFSRLCPIVSGHQSVDPSLSSAPGSEPVPALDGKRHCVKITPVGVAVLKVDEQAFIVDEVRPGVPSRYLQLDQAVARHPEGDNVLYARSRIITKVAGRRHANQPFFAAERPRHWVTRR